MAQPRQRSRKLDDVRLACPADPAGQPLQSKLSKSDARAVLEREALRWTYVLRSRRRWVDAPKARERTQTDARTTLAAIGVDLDRLDAMAKDGCIVVRMPYVVEEQGWAARILPWEYLLAAATRERRMKLSSTGRPAPLTVMRELQRQPLTDESDGQRPMKSPPTALFVECLPSEIREHWSLAHERDRLRGALPADTDFQVLGHPSLEELVAVVGRLKPDLIHFAGLDSHQGLRELRTRVGPDALVEVSEPQGTGETGSPSIAVCPVDQIVEDRRLMADGLLLKGDQGPRVVRAHEFARALGASGHCAYLTTFNLWNTAARVAPLLVAEGASLAALGFQDAFDDALAEFIHATLYAQLGATGWHLPEAFRQTWGVVRTLPDSVNATGVSLWAGDALLPRMPRGVALPTTATAQVGPRAPQAIRCDIAPLRELNYAVVHNAQPLFEKFVLECDEADPSLAATVNVAVHLGDETARYSRQVSMTSQRLSLAEDIHVPLTAKVARTVSEALNTSLSVHVQQGERVLVHQSHRLRLLPVDQWRDNRRDGRWLPSFVQPRDLAVARAVEQAQRYNRVLRDDPNAGFEGYQLADAGDEESLRGVDRQVEALWATLLHDWQLGYINPPPSYSADLDSQRLRMPSQVARHRAGTCIDLALLFAACLELIDVYPVIFLLEGHALPGWWRHPKFREEYFDMPSQNFAEVVDASATENAVANAQQVAWHTGKASWLEVRRWVRERKLVPIETVRLTEHCGFIEAIEAGVAALAERRDFDSMLDIVTAREKQVTPLPLVEGTP